MSVEYYLDLAQLFYPKVESNAQAKSSDMLFGWSLTQNNPRTNSGTELARQTLPGPQTVTRQAVSYLVTYLVSDWPSPGWSNKRRMKRGGYRSTHGLFWSGKAYCPSFVLKGLRRWNSRTQMFGDPTKRSSVLVMAVRHAAKHSKESTRMALYRPDIHQTLCDVKWWWCVWLCKAQWKRGWSREKSGGAFWPWRALTTRGLPRVDRLV